MGHITSKNYKKLQKKLNDSAQGAPESETLFKILEILFTEDDAGIVVNLPLNFFSIEKASKILKKSETNTLKILNDLADKGILMDFQNKKEHRFILAPSMAGFIEFSLMRTDGKFDRKILSELFYQYLNQEEDFVKRIFSQKTPIDRVFVHEESLKNNSEILDYEKANTVIDTASNISLGTCYCRHKMEHLGKACNNPQNVCLTFNKAADGLIKHGIAKKISKKKAKTILEDCIKRGLVQIGDNVQNQVNWICNCCGCCCEAILSYKKLGHSCILTSNFVSIDDKEKCIACGTCVKKCPVNAIKIIENEGKKFAETNQDVCIGCGVCTRFCPTNCIEMKRVKNPKLVPKDSFERMVSMAIDTGTLQNYLFDNYNLLSHKILRNLLGIILSFPLTKQILASNQLKSRFLNRLVKTKHFEGFDKIYYQGENVDYSHNEFKKK